MINITSIEFRMFSLSSYMGMSTCKWCFQFFKVYNGIFELLWENTPSHYDHKIFQHLQVSACDFKSKYWNRINCSNQSRVTHLNTQARYLSYFHITCLLYIYIYIHLHISFFSCNGFFLPVKITAMKTSVINHCHGWICSWCLAVW